MNTTKDKERNIYQLDLDFKAVRNEAKEAGTHAGYKLCLDMLQESHDEYVMSLIPVLTERTSLYKKPSMRLLQNFKDADIANTYNRAFLLAVYSIANLLPHPEKDKPSEHLCSLFSQMDQDAHMGMPRSLN